MNSLIIEMRSVIIMKDYLTRNQRLIPDIRENDKTPSWDGEIIVYSSELIEKKYIEGRVPVQIKGSFQENLSQNTIKFDLESSDLRNYQSSNGVIIFVVYMKGFDECKIYYNALLPFDLNKLINDMGNQKSKRIELQEFPKDNTIEVMNIFYNFLKNQKLQGGTIDNRIFSLEDVGKLGIEIDMLHFSYTGIGLNNINNAFNYSLRYPTYVYLQPKGLDIKVPVDKINIQNILSNVSAPITVAGEVIYNSYKVLYEIDNTILKIGKSINFDFSSGKINYKISGNLSERIRDVKFLIALYSNDQIKINEVEFPNRTVDDPSVEIEKQKKHLSELKEIKLTLNILGVNQDLEIDKLSEKEFIYLYYLVRSILYNKPVPLSLNNMPGIGNLNIGNLVLCLICEKSNVEGNFLLLNFFGEHNICHKYSNNGEDIILSPYIKLTKKEFLMLSNINYKKIVESIKKTTSKVQEELANQLVLEMLNAYDESKEKNSALLKSAQEIMDWLFEQATVDSAIVILNRFQIAKRKRELSLEELNEITKIKMSTTDEAILIGANILMESFVEAKIHYERLSEEDRKQFDTYPIMNLWKRK